MAVDAGERLPHRRGGARHAPGRATVTGTRRAALVKKPATPPPARETSWRDLVRRLARNPAKPR